VASVNGGNGGRCSVIVISRKNSQVKFIDKVASLKQATKGRPVGCVPAVLIRPTENH